MPLYLPMRPYPIPAPTNRLKWGEDLVADFKSRPPLTAAELAAQEQRGRIRQELVELLSAGKITLPDLCDRPYGPKTWLMDY